MYAYGGLSMCAEFGGYLGLLLGVSLLDLGRVSRFAARWVRGRAAGRGGYRFDKKANYLNYCLMCHIAGFGK